MALTTSERKLFRPGLMALVNTGLTGRERTEYQHIVGSTINTQQSYEEIATRGGLGPLRRLDETEGVSFQEDPILHYKTFETKMFALGFQVSERALRKDMYGYAKGVSKRLMASARATLDVVAFSKLMAGFDIALAPDGLAVFGTHTNVESGLAQNNRVTAAFSVSALESALILHQSQVNERGLPLVGASEKLRVVHGPSLGAQVVRVIKSQRLSGTADNDTNDYIASQCIPKQCKYLGTAMTTRHTNVILLPDAEEDNPFIFLQSKLASVDTDKNIYHSTEDAVVTMEFDFDWKDWRRTVAIGA